MANIQIHRTKNISAIEYASLMAAVGWGTITDYDAVSVSRSIDSYPFVAHARTDGGTLVGYVSAFSDGVFSTFIGEVLVHPDFQRQGVGSRLLEAVEARYCGVPVYAKPFRDQELFFLCNGYRAASRPMSVLFKKNEVGGSHAT